MKRLATFALVMLVAGRSNAAGNRVDGPNADLMYDPATGNVRLDASDLPIKRIRLFVLETQTGQMNPDVSLPFPLICSGLVTWSSHEVGCVDLVRDGWALAELGPILPQHLSIMDLFDFFSTATYGFGAKPPMQFDVTSLT